MQALLTALITWLSANYALPANYDLPAVKFAAPMEIASIRYSAFGPQQSREAIAAYNALPADQRQSIVSIYEDTTKTIVLPVGWQGRTPAELSILVHEMVHHLQNLAGLTYACPQEREALAYEAQEKWLGLFGRSLASEFEIDGMALLVKTKCLY
ncbi:MAG: DUF6647 family protein [Rhodoplanes sp.]|jgi:hypothetical protein